MNAAISCLYLHYDPTVNVNEFLDIEICKKMLQQKYGDDLTIELHCWKSNGSPWPINADIGFYLLLIDHFNIEHTLSLIKCIKTLRQDACIILTGDLHEDFGMQLLMEYDEIDIVVYDKIAPVYYRVLDTLFHKIDVCDCPGIIYKTRGMVIKNPPDTKKYDMDEFPYAGHTFFEINHNDYIKIFSHKGCAGCCSFCNLSTGNYKNTLSRNGRRVVEEMAYLQETYQISKFDLLDLSILDFGKQGIQRLEDMIQEILNRQMHVCVSYQIRADQINENTRPLLRKARQAGINYAFVGIESICEEELHLFNKRARVEDNFNAIRILKEENIGFTVGFLPFHAKTTFQNLYKNLEFLHDIGYTRVLEKFINPIMVYPGTALFNQYQDEGLLDNYHFPQGFSYITYQDPAVRKLLDCLMDMPAYEANLEDLDIAVTWLLVELDSMADHLAADILELRRFIITLQQEQNEINYHFLKTCLKMGENGRFAELREFCNTFNLNSYKIKLQSVYTKLSIKCNRIKRCIK